MSNRKRWATKQEAEKFIADALEGGRTGLSFCAACDFLGYNPREKVEEYERLHKKGRKNNKGAK
jgi:hypothetical protein